MSEPAQRQTVPPACPACGGGLRETGWVVARRSSSIDEQSAAIAGTGFNVFKETVRCLTCDVEWAVGPMGWLEVSGPGKRGSTTRRWLRRERAREHTDWLAAQGASWFANMRPSRVPGFCREVIVDGSMRRAHEDATRRSDGVAILLAALRRDADWEEKARRDFFRTLLDPKRSFIIERTDLPPMPDLYRRRDFTIAPHQDDASGDETVYATGWPRR